MTRHFFSCFGWLVGWLLSFLCGVVGVFFAGKSSFRIDDAIFFLLLFCASVVVFLAFLGFPARI